MNYRVELPFDRAVTLYNQRAYGETLGRWGRGGEETLYNQRAYGETLGR